MSLAALDAVDDAIEATKRFLTPFDRARWFRLAVVMFFVAGGGVSLPQFPTGGFGDGTGEPGGPGTDPGGGSVPTPELTGELLVFLVALAAFVVGVALLLAIAGAVMEFVFVEGLSREEVRLWTPFKRHWWRGVRLFAFRAGVWLLGVAAIAAVLFVAGVGLGGWPPTGWGGEVLVGLFLVAIPVFLLALPLLGTVVGFTNMFVVPVMYREERGVLGAWRRFWPTLTGNLTEYLVYLVVGFLLGIAIGIAVGFLTLVVLLVVGIPFAVVGIPLVLVLGFSGAGAVVALVLGLAFVVVVFVALLLVKVPFQTFTRYYALLVLGDTNPEFDVIPDARRAVRTDGGDGDGGDGGGAHGGSDGPAPDAPDRGSGADGAEWGGDSEWGGDGDADAGESAGDDTGSGDEWNVDDDERF